MYFSNHESFERISDGTWKNSKFPFFENRTSDPFFEDNYVGFGGEERKTMGRCHEEIKFNISRGSVKALVGLEHLSEMSLSKRDRGTSTHFLYSSKVVIDDRTIRTPSGSGE